VFAQIKTIECAPIPANLRMNLCWFARLITAKDNIALLFSSASKLIPEFQVIKIAIGSRFTGFNFNGHNILPFN
jgi:hypothetical protein